MKRTNFIKLHNVKYAKKILTKHTIEKLPMNAAINSANRAPITAFCVKSVKIEILKSGLYLSRYQI